MTTPLIETRLPRRIRNALERVGVTTLEDLTRLTAEDLLACPQVGETSALLVRGTLLKHGMELKVHDPRVYPYDHNTSIPADQLVLWMNGARAEEKVGMRRYVVISSAFRRNGTVHVFWCEWASKRQASWYHRVDQLPELAKDCKECGGSGVRP